MMQNVVEYQVSSMKDHPHIKKIEVFADRLVQVIYYPKNLKSDYAKLQYRIKLDLPQNYPQKSPIVKFIDSINHPNICNKTGQVKMPLLQEDWSSYFTLYIIIDLLDTLLMQPQIDQKYCPNLKPKQNNKRGMTTQQEKDQIQSINNTRPIQSIKNKLKKMKTIILEKAEGNEFIESVELQGSLRKTEIQRKQLTSINKVSKIAQDKQSKIHISKNIQCQQNKQQLRTTVKSAKNPHYTFFIPPSQTKNIIQNGSNILVRSKNIEILQKSKSSCKQLKQDKLRIPQLKREKIDQDFIDVHKDITKTNTTLQDNNTQLNKIRKLLNDFYSDYEDLATRRSSTKSPELIEIIQQKMRQQLGLIEQLNNLTLLIKKKMIRDVRNCLAK